MKIKNIQSHLSTCVTDECVASAHTLVGGTCTKPPKF